MELKDVYNFFDTLRTIYTLDFMLKDKQAEIILALLNSRNVFGLLPTGYGKSMCYILPPLILDEMDWSVKHTAVVVSPLKALMEDQVRDIISIGINAVAVQPETSQEVAKDMLDGKFSVVFISPESSASPFWRNVFLSDQVSCKLILLACDEAHCISEWGEDFRPTYKEVLNLRSIIDAPVLAVTGTCDENVRKDIFSTLCLSEDDTLTVTVIPDRPNIYLDVRKSKEDSEKNLDWLLQRLLEKGVDCEKGIVYCRSINATARLYNHLKLQLKHGGAVDGLLDMYHSSVDSDSKDRILTSFKKRNSSIRFLISTIAFGMGIQVPDIRCIVHWGVPKSALCYWQEVGRAGRGGMVWMHML